MENKGKTSIKSSKYNLVFAEDTLKPALPWISFNVLIGSEQSFSNFVPHYDMTLLKSGVQMKNNMKGAPVNQIERYYQDVKNSTYTQHTYPDTNIKYTGTHYIDDYKIVSFLVCPFYYDVVECELLMLNSISIDINLETIASVNNQELRIKSGVIRDIVKQIVINDEDTDELYPISINRVLPSVNNIPDCKYLIITNNTLKPYFEKLAQWKTTKGIKATVLTVETINSLYTDGTQQLRIKRAIKDYHDNGVEFVLLGGDVDVIPAQMCYLPYYDGFNSTPVDLFYSCFQNNFGWDQNGNGIYGEENDNVDLYPAVVLSRLSVNNAQDAINIVNRIINYERTPNTLNWADNILCAGNISNTSMNDMYSNAIAPNWSGSRFRLYSSFTDHPLGANYDYIPQNLQTELGKGYTFLDLYSHGWIPWWGFLENSTKYDTSNASQLVNVGNTVITTISCLTNAFDIQDSICLSEALMRNPNSGILAYWGCSRHGWTNCYNSHTEALYNSLFNDPEHRLGVAATQVKLQYGYVTSSTDNYHKMQYVLNLLGDPEMPVLISEPLEFTTILSSFTNGTLIVATGLSGCRICVSSSDNGESYYEVVENANSHTFTNIPPDCTLCITKPGYIPFVRRADNGLYIQNETISNNRYFDANDVYIGRNVTLMEEEGPVSIVSGQTTIEHTGTVTIKNSFNVESGASLNICPQ